MKIKYANNPQPKKILDCKFKSIRIDDENFNGYISLVDVTKAKGVSIVPRNNGKGEKIFDNYYKWLLLYPIGKGYTITAMYNEKCELIEFYFDMADNISITRDNIPYMHDLFLDVVVTKENEIYVLDQDELYLALQNHDITPRQYVEVNKTSEYIISKYSKKENFSKLKEYCSYYLKFLLDNNE